MLPLDPSEAFCLARISASSVVDEVQTGWAAQGKCSDRALGPGSISSPLPRIASECLAPWFQSEVMT
jgi:hypothetical protein